mgnify:CR=1 FL=1
MRETFIDDIGESRWALALMRSGAGLVLSSATRDGESVDVSSSSVEPGDDAGTLWLVQGDDRRQARLAKVGDDWWVHFDGHVSRIRVAEPGATRAATAGAGLTAPMPGKVLAVMCAEGDSVEAGQALMVLEAMKMENRICAAVSGKVSAICHDVGAQVDQGALLIEIEPAGDH